MTTGLTAQSTRGRRLSRRRGVLGLIAIGLALVAAVLVYLMYLNPVDGEEIVPAGYARNTSSYVSMGDGTRLAADVWVPADLEADQRLPAIMTTTRYWRAHDMGPIYRLLVGLDEASVPNIWMADEWNGAGYVLVLVDARGSGASSGQRPVEWSDAEVADLGEVTEWITSQSWSDGNVGAVGISYSGNTAELSAIPAHPALRAVAPLYSDFDPQFFLTMPGGVYNREFVEAWNGRIRRSTPTTSARWRMPRASGAGGSSSRCRA